MSQLRVGNFFSDRAVFADTSDGKNSGARRLPLLNHLKATSPGYGEPDMGYISRSITVLCLGTALAVPAQANIPGHDPLGTGALSLSNDDYEHLVGAADGLLRRSPLPIGTTMNWRNEQTGSTGTIRVTQTFRRGAQLCHRLVYETIPAGEPPASHTTIDWCDTGGGKWKIIAS
jgi:hypothetical protein